MFKFITLSLIGAVALSAAPLFDFVPGTGRTSVVFSGDFLRATSSLNVRVTGSSPDTLRTSLQGLQASFPITAGFVDLGVLKLNIPHSGGLTLTAGTVRVDLTDFVIENTRTTAGTLRLTGLVRANGVLVGRVPLFNLALVGSPQLDRFDFSFGSMALLGVNANVALTKDAADALNAAFSVTAFVEGFSIGSANVQNMIADLTR